MKLKNIPIKNPIIQVLLCYILEFHAEASRKFLVGMLNKWKASDPIEFAGFRASRSTRLNNIILDYYTLNEKANKALAKQGGIYFICCQTNTKDIYPFYVGMTGQTFNERLGQHKIRGVFQGIDNEKWESDFCKDFTVYVKEADVPTAKFLESTFLLAFDFARNKEENYKKDARRLLRNVPTVDREKHFHQILDDKFKNLKSAIQELK